ncbi:protein fluG [Penicillium canariense]|uniref:Glutamine synthetase n=1 Tax=Penicillium canariense TaxID=189055 RepID=A0A9W9ID59_9EURO|nr:protein fluG [Penicillium canariense]KAJ5175404.1 protein fluG [Penicillium canariense]
MTRINENPSHFFPCLHVNPKIDPQKCLDEFLQQNTTVQFVRLQWQDYSGLLRARIVVLSHFRSLIAAEKPLHVPPIGFHCIVDNNLVPWLDPTGAHLLLPDYTSLRLLPGRPRYAVLMCGVVETRPSSPQQNWDLCPRHALANVVHAAMSLFDVEFLVGFEVEFEILHRSSSSEEQVPTIIPFSTGLGRYAVDGLRDPGFPLVEDAVQTLIGHGVGVQTIQTEGRRGQYEISLGPRSPLDAVDELVLVHDTLKESFARRGYVVTMAPRPIASRRQAIGQHTHISIRSTKDTAIEERSFLAGILARLPMLCAVCLPYGLSYERVKPYLGGNQVAWGTENREMPIRQIRPGHWELRCVDATANMYLALATVLSAGLLGISRKEPLRWPDTALHLKEPCQNDVRGSNGVNGSNGAIQKPAMSSQELLPENLEASLDALEHGGGLEDLTSMIGSGILHQYLSVKRFESLKLEQMEPPMVRDLLTELF